MAWVSGFRLIRRSFSVGLQEVKSRLPNNALLACLATGSSFISSYKKKVVYPEGGIFWALCHRVPRCWQVCVTAS